MGLYRANYPLGAAPGQSAYNKMFADAIERIGDPSFALWCTVKPVPNMAEETMVVVSDVGMVPARSSEDAALTAAKIDELAKVTLTMTEYGIRFDSPEYQYDTLPEEIRMMTPGAFAAAAAATAEQLAANILVTAFSTTGWDGKALCANDHPISGGTNDNLLTTALSSSALSVARGLWNRQKTNKGKPLARPAAAYLAVPPELENTARQILGATWATSSGTGGDANPNQNWLQPLMIPYLTSDVDWFVVGNPADDPYGARVIVNRAPRFNSGFDSTTESYFGIASLVMGAGFMNYKWIVGSNT